MTQISINYAIVLYQLGVSKEDIRYSKELFEAADALYESLASPVVTLHEKYVVIDRLFPESMRAFFKVLCRNQSVSLIDEIFQAYRDYADEQENVLRAKLFYVENIENIDFDAILCGVIDSKKPYEEKYTKKIPVAAAGGIFDRQDIDHVLSLGADAVQIASRFVVTKECDASDAYKRAYIEAGKGNIQIVKSPVGMPGRAVRNAFIRQVEQHKQEITGCYQCLEKCNPKEVPYCITQALIHAVKGELEQGLIFCGENVSRIHEMTTVPELMRELTQG